MNAIETEHIWTSPLIDMRFNYKPQNPLYLLLVRTYRLAKPVTVDNTPEYAGCKSWCRWTSQLMLECPSLRWTMLSLLAEGRRLLRLSEIEHYGCA